MRDPLREISRRIVEEVDPDSVILFGSRAKGKGKRWSDHDICVLKRGVKVRKELEKKIYLKLYGIGVPVDIIVETPKRFETLKQNRFLIYHEIAKHGRVVYEKQRDG
jgi:predicted nucleotidyltransferase